MMTKAYILRRHGLGSGSCKGIIKASKTVLIVCNTTKDQIPQDKDLLCIRWGTTATVPQKNILNSAKAIHLVNDKSGFRKLLQEKGLCPETFFESFNIEGCLGPMIVRPRHHAQGKHLYIVKSNEELTKAISLCGPGWYATEFIDKAYEYRVFFGSGRALCVARKYPKDETSVAWNVAQGGKFENVKWNDWPLLAVKRSLEAAELSELDFGGIDVILDKQGKSYILEINSAPCLISEYRMACFAKYFDYISENGKEKIPLISVPGGYTKFIHPAIEPKAKV